MWTRELKINHSFDFSSVINRYKNDPMFTIEDNIVKFGYDFENKVIVSIAYNGNLIINSNGDKDEVINSVKRLLQLETNLDTIADSFKNTNLETVFNLYRGTPLCLDINIEISLFRAIIHQQISMKGAFTLTRRFLDKFGDKIDNIYFFPKIEKIANLVVTDLTEIKINRSKADYIINVAKMIHNNELILKDFKSLTNDEIFKKLISIKGIGTWTINCLLLFGLGRKDLYLKNDLGLINAIKKYENLKDKPSKEYIEKYSKDWPPYRTYATFYLWRYLSNNL